MKIEKITIENFRGFSGKTTINFDQLNVFIGKNDAGKSTILEALDIFFHDGKGIIKIDKGDKNIHHQKDDLSITVSFSGCPEKVIIDSTNKTSLKAEYLLNGEDYLEIKKVFTGTTVTPYIVAMHPTCELGEGLLLTKINDLRKVVKTKGWECAHEAKSAELRKTIWENCCKQEDLKLEITEIPAKKIGDEERVFWGKIEKLLPIYALFQSDRENKDGDSEVQDPIKFAVKQILESEKLKNQLESIAQTVREKIEGIIGDTLKELKAMNSEVAENLKANILETSQLKWSDVFKGISISDGDEIPLNKHGSGVKRLVLLSFFKAEVERKKKGDEGNNIIYAMEEPETAQHPEHQKILINAFKGLSQNCQILLTTHSPLIVQLLTKGNHNLNLIKKENGKISIKTGEELLAKDRLALKHLSGNEISYLAFDYVSAEFHTELYSFIDSNHKPMFKEKILNQNKNMPAMSYTQEKPDGTKEGERNITLQEYIRHQIHHPENKRNDEYSQDQLRKSIDEMREWLLASN